MDYIEVKVTCAGDACELLAEELAELTGGCQIDDPRTLDDFLNAPVKRWDYIEQQLLDNPVREPSLRFFLSADEEGARILEEVRTILAGIKEQDEFGFYGSLEMEVSEAQSQDWENNWKQYYKPFCVGNRLFVCPSWEEAETHAGRTLLTMDPASSFGTGSPATTRMCMEQLDALQLDDANILDVGCGSGILACTALLLGGKHALACDIEENAMVVTKENMEKNDVAPARYTTRCGDLLSDPVLADELQSKGPYDVILANIVADVLMAMRDYLLRWVKADGRIILSGIIAERAAEVRASFEAGGAEIVETRSRDGWVMYCVKRK